MLKDAGIRKLGTQNTSKFSSNYLRKMSLMRFEFINKTSKLFTDGGRPQARLRLIHDFPLDKMVLAHAAFTFFQQRCSFKYSDNLPWIT